MQRRIATRLATRLATPLATLLACALAGAALAQDPPGAVPAAAPAPQASAAPAPPQVSLADAYRREFAFLEAQQRQLTQQLGDSKARAATDSARLSGEISAIEARVLAARAEADARTRELSMVDEQQIAIEASSELLAATFAQAEASLSGYGVNLAADPGYQSADDAARLGRLIELATAQLQTFASVSRAPGEFFLADGSAVDGHVIRIGNVARLGVSDQGAGALAPAGGGAFKLWAGPDSSASARALAAGEAPTTLALYLFENPNLAAERQAAKSFGQWLASGGAIGYVIALLGLVGVLLAIARAVFLKGAGASVNRIMEGVSGPIAEGRFADAIEACKRYKGSAARVVTAALRNLDRDREHLEDIVSEAILHESGHLNRFGSMILLIAAVAPLLGLLGTVTGMIQTFDVITEFGTSDPKLLSGGISVALVTTQIGLIVAIPMLLVGNLMNGWAERIKDDMEKAALKVVNLSGEARRPGAVRA